MSHSTILNTPKPESSACVAEPLNLAPQALSAMDEVQALAKKCVRKYGGSGGGSPAARTLPVTPVSTRFSSSIPNVPSFGEWTNGSECPSSAPLRFPAAVPCCKPGANLPGPHCCSLQSGAACLPRGATCSLPCLLTASSAS